MSVLAREPNIDLDYVHNFILAPDDEERLGLSYSCHSKDSDDQTDLDYQDDLED
jgi:hypothetical protein